MIDIPQQIMDYFGSSNLPAFWLLPRIMGEDSSLGKSSRQMANDLNEIINSDKPNKPSWMNILPKNPSE